jgi:hypothetical protein
MPKTIELDGEQVEVFTAEEVQAARTEEATKTRTAVEGEFTPKLTEAQQKLKDAQDAAATRAGEFSEFRKLNEEQVKQLSEKDRIIYENTLKLKESEDKRIAAEEAGQKTAVATVIKSKAGGNEALAKKMEEMWPLITVDATTPEQIEAKALMVLGAISTTTPDLIAGVAGFTGSYAPPGGNSEEGKSFADTERGKAGAKALGLILEPPKAS